MKNENESNIMEFEAIDGEPVEKPEETAVAVKEETEKQPGFFKKALHVVTAPARFVGRKIKENPASALVGGAIGGGLALGGKAAWDYFRHKHSGSDEDYVEVEDSGEEIIDITDDTDIDEAM